MTILRVRLDILALAAISCFALIINYFFLNYFVNISSVTRNKNHQVVMQPVIHT